MPAVHELLHVWLNHSHQPLQWPWSIWRRLRVLLQQLLQGGRLLSQLLLELLKWRQQQKRAWSLTHCIGHTHWSLTHCIKHTPSFTLFACVKA
jgi:hypothetical protein